MAARNDVTGDLIKSRNNNSAFESNWDAIFGKKEVVEEVVEEVIVPEASSDIHEDTTGQ